MAKRRPTDERASPAQGYRWRLLAVLGLCVVGIALSSWLIWIHEALQANPDAGSACNLGDYFNCDVVNASRFASVLGVPVAYGAFSLYVVLGALALRELSGSEIRVVVYCRVLGTLALLYSLYLAALSLTVLHALCVFCVGLYVVNAGLALLGWLRPPARLRVLHTLRLDASFLAATWHASPVWAGFFALLLGAAVLWHVGRAERARSASEPVTIPIQNTRMSIAPGHAEGPEGTGVVVVEFSDFECPHCRQASTALEETRKKFAGQVRFVFKHFPLSRMCNRAVRLTSHRDACAAADAAVCAGEQERLWEFQKEVFSRGADNEALVEAATAVGLDLAAWQTCRWTTAARDVVLADVEDGLRLGVNKTPTFLVGNQLIAGASATDEVPAEIERQLGEKGR